MDYFTSTSLKKLEKVMDAEKDPVIKQKLLLVWHKKTGKPYRAIGKMFRIPKSTVSEYIQRFKVMGIEGLHRKPGSGGHNKYLTETQEKQLQEKLKREPMTAKEVLVYIKQKFNKEYHPNSISRLMKRLNQSLITPRPRHYEANPRSGYAFKGHIKKDQAMGS